MATEKPRITITLEPREHEVLQRLSKLQGRSMSGVLREFLGEVTPILEKTVTALELVQRSSADARAKFVKAAAQAEEELRPLAEFVGNQFDTFAAEIGRVVEREERTAAATRDETGPRTARAGTAGGAAAGSPRPVITGATGVQRSAGDGTGRADLVVLKPRQRKASSDEAAGIQWWNGLTERQRASWMKKAGNTGVAADAWACFKSASLEAK